MKIYTKGGDAGETGLYGGSRVSKTHPRIQAYGTLDELNAVLGMQHGASDSLRQMLTRIQGELFQLGAELATPAGKKVTTRVVGATETARLEQEIDAMEARLQPLKTFILPGGSALAAQLHLARTVSRRAEREVLVLHEKEPLRPEVLQYLNRLSDALFVCARFANLEAGVQDTPWVAP